jgi:hypothetical protein
MVHEIHQVPVERVVTTTIVSGCACDRIRQPEQGLL